MKLLEKKSITEYINENSGKTGVNFYTGLYDENPSNYVELTKELENLLEGKLKILSFDINLNNIEIYTDKGIKKFTYDNFKTLGIIESNSKNKDQLHYFRLINELLSENSISERIIIYYDELEPDTHWIGLIDKKKSHELYDFVKKSESNEIKNYIINGVRVFGIGIADEEFSDYAEIVIFP